jgi:hypothetical protein
MDEAARLDRSPVGPRVKREDVNQKVMQTPRCRGNERFWQGEALLVDR